MLVSKFKAYKNIAFKDRSQHIAQTWVIEYCVTCHAWLRYGWLESYCPGQTGGNTLHIPPWGQRAVLWVWWHGTAQVCIWRHEAPLSNTSGRAQPGAGQPPPWPAACGTLGPAGCGWRTSTARSSTEKYSPIKKYLSSNKNICTSTCKQVTLAQKKGANLPPQRPPWHSSHSWSSRT